MFYDDDEDEGANKKKRVQKKLHVNGCTPKSYVPALPVSRKSPLLFCPVSSGFYYCILLHAGLPLCKVTALVAKKLTVMMI